jgi:putative intracellular protease/amidase
MPPAKSIYVLVFDGMADWEPAYALAELRRWGNRQVAAVGFDQSPIRTMGGLAILPDTVLAKVDPLDVELLILPGGDIWESRDYPRSELEGLLKHLVAEGTTIAAICGGTLALARAGILDDRRHTSTVRTDLERHAPEYRGKDYYVDVPAISHNSVITASGLAPVDFARAIFAELSVFTPADEQMWFEMYRHARLPESAI